LARLSTANECGGPRPLERRAVARRHAGGQDVFELKEGPREDLLVGGTAVGTNGDAICGAG